MISNTIIVAAILLLLGPKKMLHIVIAALLAYSFPLHAILAAAVFGTGYYLYKKHNPFK